MKKIIITILIVLLCVGLGYYVANRSYVFKSEYTLNQQQYDTLARLGSTAINTLDVPVASILVYRGIIIGSGYNTVMKNTRIGEHAEINAISSAIAKSGFEKFSSLNRDSLMLITTYEPCLMCTGAIIENNITHVYVVKEKTFRQNISDEWKWLKFLISRDKTDHTYMQDSLFEMHPYYPMRNQ